MITHTPGPWIFEEDQWGNIAVISANADDLSEEPVRYFICEKIGGHVRGEYYEDYSEPKANAALIAAAPDLIAALEKVVIRLDANLEDKRSMGPGSMGYLLQICTEAISKAKGES